MILFIFKPFSLLGVLPPLSVRVFLALVSSALPFPSLWPVPPLSLLDKNGGKKILGLSMKDK